MAVKSKRRSAAISRCGEFVMKTAASFRLRVALPDSGRM